MRILRALLREKRSPPATSSAAKRDQGPAATSNVETGIGANTYCRGDVVSDDDVRIDGTLEGSIKTTGSLVVSESARIVGDVEAGNISVSGAIKGNIDGNRVEILETGRVWGDLTINSLLLDEGAYLSGRTAVRGDIEPPMIELSSSRSKLVPMPDGLADT
jgi:cytoskeletal protein CcmA (bactofilin family)